MRRLFACLLFCCVGLNIAMLPGSADPPAHRLSKEEQKRAQLAKVHRVVVIPPFFGTETLTKAAKLTFEEKPKAEQEQANNNPAKNDAASQPSARKPEETRLLQIAEYLRQLQDHARTNLPQRLAKRGGLEIVPTDEMNAALKDLQLTPEKMFENEGRMKGTRFPLPLSQAVQDVAKICHADAVVLGVLDEPRRVNGRYYFDPLAGFNYETGFVETHAGFYLMLPDGTEGLHGYMRVRNPLSKQNGRPFVMADWIDTQDLMIENMMDEWTYYLPRKQ